MDDGNTSRNIRREIVELFSELEDTLDVVDIEWNGFQIWPIVRSRLALMLQSSSRRPTTLTDQAARIAKPLTRFARKRILPEPPPPELPSGQCDVVVFGDDFRSEEFGPAPNQDRTTGPIGMLLQERGIRVCYVPRGSEQTWTAQTSQWKPSATGPHLNSELRQVLDKVNQKFQRAIDWHAIASQLEQLYSESIGIEKTLVMQRPKSVVLPCWYASGSLPITLACHRQNIPVIEMQHGLIDEDHPCYGGFRKVPTQPYKATCDAIWFWGNRIESQIKESSPGLMHDVQAFVGGYPYLHWNLDQSQNWSANREQPTILVAMQDEGFFDKLVADVMQLSPSDWHWLVKFHPRTGPQLADSFRRCATDEVNKKVEQGNRILKGKNIYQLFSDVNCVLTGWSTVALEARIFGIPVIILHENGRTAFKGFVEADDMKFATSAEAVHNQILNLINSNSMRSESSVASQYFASKSTCDQAVNELVARIDTSADSQMFTDND